MSASERRQSRLVGWLIILAIALIAVTVVAILYVGVLDALFLRLVG